MQLSVFLVSFHMQDVYMSMKARDDKAIHLAAMNHNLVSEE